MYRTKSLPGAARALATAAALVLAVSAGCASHSAQPKPPAVSHRGVGVVVAVDAAKGRVKINHEKIEGYMEAMTMWFEVKDPKSLEDIAPSDRVEFVLTEEESADVITEIRKAG